ncbi:DUF2798 domain-containing protein [Methylobacterium sp. BTF04]|uniref:DUF2798 domain-containing protein n=1 Tax=Methylobacterium sp. BTF04 TaxID=2708300 RepID=UPI0013D7D39E|nr:DUF2798 domain-containing protein [Methylobacterium sp. BTF04]NEU13858.1 DUF2798 domain-containing protein [Methylobacterium sp. BTF04]
MPRLQTTIRLRRLPARYGAVVMPLVLSLLMTCIVSAVAMIRNRGLSQGSLALWPSTWALSWIFTFPTVLILLPLFRRIVGLVVEAPTR